MKKKTDEPTFEAAVQSWTDIPNIWTPIGWKDHLFRFNVLWNGALYAQPDLNRRTEKWRGLGVNLTFVPWMDGSNIPSRVKWPVFVAQDDGLVRQGWRAGDAPTLWSEWPAEGLLLRSEIFGHIPGGRDVRAGIEPLFAWIRLIVHDAVRALPLEKEVGFIIRINAPALIAVMSSRGHRLEYPPYPRELHPRAPAYSPRDGFTLLEPDGKVRLAVAPRQRCSAAFFPGKEGGNDALMFLSMPARVGAHVDLLAPMLPTEQSVFQAELALGRQRALRQADAYWRKRPATAASFCVPETPIVEAIRHNLAFAEVVAEKNPANGDYAMLTGALCYADMWATPFAMACVMTLDALGYHGVVEKYLEIFRKEQGTVVPPGDSLRLHPGYLSTPKTLTSCDWLSDHGALLYAISEHALLSGNRRFIARWLPAIVKACEFIQHARSATGHGGVERLLPPAVATDTCTKTQAVWNDGWNYKGLATAARLLRRIGHERAMEFTAAAVDYRRTFQAAFRRATASMPTWRDARGRERHLTPAALYGGKPWELRHGYYLDTGPIFLVYAGLMDADDPLMRATLQWFREGPQTAFYRRDSNHRQVPCLDHEMSSCEPALSWNAFHAHQTGDRQAFLTAMYSLFAGAMSRKTYTMCETRGGITGLTPACMQIWLARLAVIDDQLDEDELHLLRFLPAAWCRRGQSAVFENMPTEFGPVRLRLAPARDGATLNVSFQSAFRHAPARVILHAPPMEGLRAIRVNGQPAKLKNSKVILYPAV